MSVLASRTLVILCVMPWLCLAVLTSCFDPTAPAGLSCTSNLGCPEGQSCGVDHVCRPPGQHPDAGQTPSGSPDASTPDASTCLPETCPGTCGEWSCAAGECQVNETLCTADQTCNPSTFVCDDNAECQADDVDTSVCNECGRKVCQEDGTWGSCEPYDGCGANESCEPYNGGYRCESTLACTPNTLQSQDGGCGDCGDLYCKADGSGTECRQDASECSGSDTCESSGSQWVCVEPPPECSNQQAFSCGGSTTWCYQNAPGGPDCRSCSTGFENCDGLNGCECDGVCNGSVCEECSNQQAFSCGGSTRWCYQNAPGGPDCRSCTSGFYNCDGLAGCEASDPC